MDCGKKAPRSHDVITDKGIDEETVKNVNEKYE